MTVFALIDDVSELAAALKELALGGAAIAGAVIAWKGLDAWKRQLRGKSEFEVALSLLRSCFRLREAIALVRHPMIERGEMVAALDAAGSEPTQTEHPLEWHSRGQAAVYETRWKSISDAMAELDTARIESEVLWGRDIADRVVALKRPVGILRWAVSTSLSGGEVHLSQEQRKEIRETMYLGQQPDPYGESVDAAVRAIEEYVRPKIKS